MHEVTLHRTGKNDMVFQGKLLAAVQNPDPDAFCFRRLKLSLYKTSAGKYVLGLSRQGRTSAGDLHAALSFGSWATVFEFLDQQDNIASHLLCRLRRLALATERYAIAAPLDGGFMARRDGPLTPQAA